MAVDKGLADECQAAREEAVPAKGRRGSKRRVGALKTLQSGVLPAPRFILAMHGRTA